MLTVVNTGLNVLFFFIFSQVSLMDTSKLCNNFFQGLQKYTGEDWCQTDEADEDTTARKLPSRSPREPFETLLASWKWGEISLPLGQLAQLTPWVGSTAHFCSPQHPVLPLLPYQTYYFYTEILDLHIAFSPLSCKFLQDKESNALTFVASWQCLTY